MSEVMCQAILNPYVKYKDSGDALLGKVPKHWDVVPLCSLARPKSITGQQHRELLSVYLDRGVIRFSDIKDKRTNPTSGDLSNYQAVDPGNVEKHAVMQIQLADEDAEIDSVPATVVVASQSRN